MSRCVIGIDEAGRGPLAGPVAVGAALVPANFDWTQLKGVRDSKQLSATARERIFADMKKLERAGVIRFAVRFSSASSIDRDGIVPAIRRALGSALRALDPDLSDLVLLDGGLKAPAEFKKQRTIIRGDQSEPVISLASIAAKVLRDRRMVKSAARYPSWGFEMHKGYGTVAHRRAIARVGLSGFHRASFCTRLHARPADRGQPSLDARLQVGSKPI